ncbi:MAG: hypothetical protein AAFP26_14850, partial [Planctomycetota bacterium]
MLQFPSTVPLEAGYEQQRAFYENMSRAITRELASAPDGLGLREGWWVSELDLFSLQRALVRGTWTSLVVAVAVAFVVVLASTLNLATSLLCCLAIGGAISACGALMCALGWRLNVLESIVVSLSVGLGVDFAVHYGVAYLLAPFRHDRQRRVEHAALAMTSPITLAALTTFVAGAGLATSRVLAYQRFGAFLMMVMAASWSYSLLFLLPLLAAFGPERERCRAVSAWWCCCCCCCREDPDFDEDDDLDRGGRTG